MGIEPTTMYVCTVTSCLNLSPAIAYSAHENRVAIMYYLPNPNHTAWAPTQATN